MNNRRLRHATTGLAAAAAVALCGAVTGTPAQAVTGGSTGTVKTAAEFQLTIATEVDPQLTVRNADGTWTAWRSVPDMYYLPSATTSVTQVEAGGRTFLAAMGSAIQFLIRDTDGTWNSPTDLTAPIADEVPILHSGNTPPTARLTRLMGSAFVDNEFHLFARTAAGSLHEAVRHGDGTWGTWQDVSVPGVLPGRITELSAVTLTGGDLQLLAVAGGKLWHTARAASASAFSAWSDVFAGSSGPGTAQHVSAAEVKGELQAVVTTGNGTGVYHAVRRTTGAWTVFGDVEAATRTPLGTVTGVAVGGSNQYTDGDVLQVAVLDSNGKLFHTLRNANGTWTKFGSVDAATGAHFGTASAVLASAR
ncbi:hypothetical protein KNE206_18160 [Kitasatospora sp. NE20-6]|uniref:hypothetical protein n=1 Tax=Kitasatospora sp. NE20-6 TaxID=2859066 RepID=UPI0034DC386B